MNLRREAINALWSILPKSTAIVVHGRRFRVPLQRGFDRRLLHREREPWLDALIRETCSVEGAVLLDVGANCGQTLLKAKALCPKVRYLGVEPNPACAGYAQQVITLNQLSDCSVYACALGIGAGIGQLHLATPSDPSATTIPNFRGQETGPQERDILIESGDDLIDRTGLERIDLVKIDAEGAEAEVLAGLTRAIERFRPKLACEVLRSHDSSHPTHHLRRNSKLSITQQMRRLGYEIEGITADGGRRRVVELSDEYRNYLFLPAATMRSTSALVE